MKRSTMNYVGRILGAGALLATMGYFINAPENNNQNYNLQTQSIPKRGVPTQEIQPSKLESKILGETKPLHIYLNTVNKDYCYATDQHDEHIDTMFIDDDMGIVAQIFEKPQEGTKPIYRIQKQLYTIFEGKKAQFGFATNYTSNNEIKEKILEDKAWKESGIIGHVYEKKQEGTLPLRKLSKKEGNPTNFRVIDKNEIQEHLHPILLTTNEKQIKEALKSGEWNDEGIEGYAYPYDLYEKIQNNLQEKEPNF